MLALSALLRQVLLPGSALLALTLGVVPPAAAHTSLSSTAPQDGAQLGEAPEQVVLEFTGEVIELGAAVAVAGPAGEVQAAPPAVSGSTVTAELPGGLDGGQYEVEWRVTSADGHPISGAFAFAVVDGASDGAADGGVAERVDSIEGEEAGPSTAWLVAVPAVVLGLVVAGVVAVLRRSRQR